MKRRILGDRAPGERSQCGTSKPALNVALSSPTGHRVFLRLVWVSPSPSRRTQSHTVIVQRSPRI